MVRVNRTEESELWSVGWLGLSRPIPAGGTPCGFIVRVDRAVSEYATGPFTAFFANGTHAVGRLLRNDHPPPCDAAPLMLSIVDVSEPLSGSRAIVAENLDSGVAAGSLQALVDNVGTSAPQMVNPARFVWDSRGVADGEHTVHARILGADGKVIEGTSIKIRVRNQP